MCIADTNQNDTFHMLHPYSADILVQLSSTTPLLTVRIHCHQILVWALVGRNSLLLHEGGQNKKNYMQQHGPEQFSPCAPTRSWTTPSIQTRTLTTILQDTIPNNFVYSTRSKTTLLIQTRIPLTIWHNTIPNNSVFESEHLQWFDMIQNVMTQHATPPVQPWELLAKWLYDFFYSFWTNSYTVDWHAILCMFVVL